MIIFEGVLVYLHFIPGISTNARAHDALKKPTDTCRELLVVFKNSVSDTSSLSKIRPMVKAYKT